MSRPDPVTMELVGAWLHKAEQDRAAMSVLHKGGGDCRGLVGFHAQQAAEKYLKALLVLRQREFSKTHNLAYLLDLLSGHDPDIAEEVGDAIELNPYGVEMRYPADMPEPTETELERHMQITERVAVLVGCRIEELTGGQSPPSND